MEIFFLERQSNLMLMRTAQYQMDSGSPMGVPILYGMSSKLVSAHTFIIQTAQNHGLFVYRHWPKFTLVVVYLIVRFK